MAQRRNGAGRPARTKNDMDSARRLGDWQGMQPRPPVRFLDRSTPPHILTLVLMAGVAAMNMSVFLPSLPHMATYFATDYATMQLSVSLYLFVTAGLQLVVGPLSDRYGRRRVMLGALGIFLLATIGCLLAPTVQVFLICRMAQAAVAVGIVLSRAVVRDMVPQNEAAAMIGYVSMGMALVPMVAPMIGGALDQVFGWQSVFVFLLAMGALVTALIWADQGETMQGAGTSFAAQARDIPDLLRARRFWGHALASAFSSGAFFAFLGGAPYAASTIFGMSPTLTGLAFGAPAIGYAFGNFLSGRLSVRLGITAMISAGALVAALGMGLSLGLSLVGLGGPLTFFGLCTALGVGNGLLLPNATAGMLSVRPHLAGTASGLGGAMMIGGGAALSVLAGHVLEGAATAQPLQALMLLTSLMALGAARYVRQRERQIGLA